ncbi:hypothetical protein [Streptomyces sp. NPDC021203]|uniref:hypothetical protein n=1 Tax=Streptomyces sp. NPDC021203 TaxID=3365117 RepID=UPI0037905971
MGITMWPRFVPFEVGGAESLQVGTLDAWFRFLFSILRLVSDDQVRRCAGERNPRFRIVVDLDADQDLGQIDAFRLCVT